MDSLPVGNNVYGELYSRASLRGVAKALRDYLGLSEEQAYVYKSHFDGNEVLKVRTEVYEFETQSLEEGDRWLFNGAVAGDASSIRMVLESLCSALSYRGYRAKFEVYDEEYELLFVYPN